MKFLSEMLDQSELDADDSELSNTTKLTYTLPSLQSKSSRSRNK